jgi:hypothetical protein
MKYECEDCEYATDNKQSYCAHRSHHGKNSSCGGWSKGLTADTDERVAKMKKTLRDHHKNPKVSPVQSWRKRRKQEFVDYLGGECKVCGYDRCIEALEFHHVDPDTKSCSITSALAHPKKHGVIKEEVDKCVLLCGNCHQEYHAGMIKF